MAALACRSLIPAAMLRSSAARDRHLSALSNGSLIEPRNGAVIQAVPGSRSRRRIREFSRFRIYGSVGEPVILLGEIEQTGAGARLLLYFRHLLKAIRLRAVASGPVHSRSGRSLVANTHNPPTPSINPNPDPQAE